MRLSSAQINAIKSVKFNPLANYREQTTDNYITKEKKVRETSLSGNLRLPFAGIDDDDVLTYKEDMAAFEYSKVICSAKNRNEILSMKPSTQGLFIWIVFALEYRSDTVLITAERINNKGLKLAHPSFLAAIAELEKRRIIKRMGRKRTNEYWSFHINPQYIFKGNAKDFYKDIIACHPEYLRQQLSVSSPR